MPGNTDSIAPPISVPPARFIIGIFPFPIFSYSHHHDCSSIGSPVVGIALILSRSYFCLGTIPDFLNILVAVGDMPKIVTLYSVSNSKILSTLGWSIAPSYMTALAPTSSRPYRFQTWPVIQPMSAGQNKMSSGVKSIRYDA